MIKKHVIACTGLFILTVSGTALILKNCPAQQKNLALAKYPLSPGGKISAEKAFTPLSFANELVPRGEPKITYRLNRELKAHGFEKLQTAMLHNKAARWFPVIEPILAEYGIPEDFKYIALVESGLKEGTSIRGASGCWQFMPGTARIYGLRVNKTIDERQNMRKSTVAACKYIRDLYNELQSWTLAAAAYNVGDTKLKYQMVAQKQRNYYRMKLNSETASYVYKLISMKEIIENPARYGYKAKPELLADAGGIRKLPGSFSGLNSLRTLEVWQN